MQLSLNSMSLLPGGCLGFERFRLSSGLQVLLCEIPDLPLAQAELAFRSGAEYDPPGLQGLASLTTPLLREGTHRHGGSEIAAEIEGRGGDAKAGVNWESGFLTLDLLAQHLDFGLDLLFEMAFSPSVPESAFIHARNLRLARMRGRRFLAPELADDWFAKAVFGDGLYGYPLQGNETTLAAVARRDLLDFWRNHFTPRRGCLIAVGRFRAAQLAKRLESIVMTGRTAAHEKIEEPAFPCPISSPQVYLVDLPNSPQTQIRMGHTCPIRTHPDCDAFRVVNAILGGSFGSRLVCALRDRKGIAYHVGSRLWPRRLSGTLCISTCVDHANAGAAVEASLQQVRLLQEQVVTAGELEDVKGFLNGTYLQSFQSSFNILERLREMSAFDLKSDCSQRRMDIVRSLTPRRVRHLSQLHLHPDRMAIVAVGPATNLRPQLVRFGEASLIDPRNCR